MKGWQEREASKRRTCVSKGKGGGQIIINNIFDVNNFEAVKYF